MMTVDRVRLAALQVLRDARKEFASLQEPWNAYRIDVELIATLLFDVGVQRVADLKVGEREYAGFLDGKARLIAVEERHHAHRQRFSVAHEVGHFVLHYLPGIQRELFVCSSADMEVSRAPLGDGARFRHLRQEWEANTFAGELLMPEEAVRAMHKVTGGVLFRMARHFEVSQKAMEIRMEALHLAVR